MPFAFDDNGVDVFDPGAGIGNDGALGNLPVAIEGAVASFVKPHRHAVKIEIGQLAVCRRPQVDPAVNAKCKQVYQLGVVGVVNPVGVGFAGEHRIDHRTAVLAVNESTIGGIDMAVKNAGDVIAIVDVDESSAEGIAVAMFDKNLLDNGIAATGKIHGEKFPVKGQCGQRYALSALAFTALDRGRIFDNLFRGAKRLLRIPELDAANLCGMLDCNEGILTVFDGKDAADGPGLVRVSRAAADRTMSADQRHIGFQHQPPVNPIRLVRRLKIKGRTARRRPIDCGLQILPIDRGAVGRQHVKLTNAYKSALDGLAETLCRHNGSAQ